MLRRTHRFFPSWTSYIAKLEEAEAMVDESGKRSGPYQKGDLLADRSLISFKSEATSTNLSDSGKLLLNTAHNVYLKINDISESAITLTGNHGKIANGSWTLTDSPAGYFVFYPSRKGKTGPAVVIIHHWNANPESYKLFGKIFSKFGLTSVVLTLPYHGKRALGQGAANGFLNANLSQTIRSVVQSVNEVNLVVQWLQTSGATRVGVVGASLGSCVAALAAAFNPSIRAVSLLLSAGDFASVVWTGRATRHIRKELERYITLEELREAWSIISPERFVPAYASNNAPVDIICGKYDKVVLGVYTETFANDLAKNDVNLSICKLPCGHYTLSNIPFSIFALWRSLKFQKSHLLGQA